MRTKHLLVIDDDKRIRTLLKKFLNESGYRVTTAESSTQARELVKHIHFDLLILDVMMPGEDGLSLTKDISRTISVPILLLSARVQTSERILGLEMGADDYLTKPFEPRELLLRVEAILKRSIKEVEPILPTKIFIGKMQYDPVRQELWKENRRVNLTSVEITLMQIFVSNSKLVITRDQLQRHIHNLSKTIKTTKQRSRSIDVQIKRLREKIEQDPKNPRYLKTVRGAGYILDPD